MIISEITETNLGTAIRSIPRSSTFRVDGRMAQSYVLTSTSNRSSHGDREGTPRELVQNPKIDFYG